MSIRKIYLAAPFFSLGEIEVCSRIERAAEAKNLNLFSPRQESGMLQGEVAKNANSIFTNNIAGMQKCTEMLCWMDRVLPKEDCSVRIIQHKGSDLEWEILSPPLTQPDIGTVWEMGWAFAQRKYLTLFTTRDRGDGKLNLMLTECVDHVVHGFEELDDYLTAFPPAYKLGNWEGDKE